LRPLAALGLADGGAPVLGWREAPVDEHLLQIQMTFVVECLREDFEDAPQYAGTHPVLKSPVAGLIGRVSVRQVGPRGAGPQNPEDAIEHKAVLPPGRPRPSSRRGSSGKKGPMRSHC